MRTIFICFLTLILLTTGGGLCAQSAGDLAFIGFNADGDDDFALVTFVDLPANTTIWFSDEEWDGTAFGTGEGSLAWNTGAAVIPAGTVIAFNTVSTATATATIGSITNPDIAISSSAEGIFAFLGTDAQTPTRFLAAIANSSSGLGVLDNTGLVANLSAVFLPNSTDVAVYAGPRTGLTPAGYLTAINDPMNWLTQNGGGDQHNDGTPPDLPFDLTAFEISTVDVTPPVVTNVNIVNELRWDIRFSEPVDTSAGPNSALNPANYVISPASLTITGLKYVDERNAVGLILSGMADGVDYSLQISTIADTAGNVMAEPYLNSRLVYNRTTPLLRITEIMYNPPASADSLEFFEIINAGTTPALIGGLEVRDQNPNSGSFGQIAFLLPSQTLAPGEIIAVAPQGPGAAAFYGVPFIDMGLTDNVLSNGGEAILIRNSLHQPIDSVAYEDALPWPTAADGNGPSLERKTLSGDSNDPGNWTASTTQAGQVGGIGVFASPGIFTLIPVPAVAFEKTHSIFTEGESLVEVILTIDQAPADTVEATLQLIDLTASPEDYQALDPTNVVVFPKNATASQPFQLRLPDNAVAQPDRYFAVRITFVLNGTAGDLTEHLVYISDNDQPAITPTRQIELEFAGRYLVQAGGAARIVAFDNGSRRLFVANSTANRLEVLDFAGPTAVTPVAGIDMSSYGSALTSVAARDGIVVALVDGVDFANGHAVFFDTNGNFLASVEVGSLPDMVTFTPDGKRVLSANEGQPNDDYTIDPEGSVSVIDLPDDVSALSQSAVTTVGFSKFNAQIDALRAIGVRIFGPGSTVAQDLEPEYIAVSEDGKIAYVTLQENNAVAIIDLTALQTVAIVPLGYKDHRLPENALDASDRTDGILFANYPIFGMYQPDAIAAFTIGGKTYLITANEGDAREYDALDEAVRFGNAAYPLDPAAFPNADLLKSDVALGRLNMTNQTGDTDGDGDFDRAYAFGARSFSIWDGQTGAMVFDSGDQLERITATDPEWSSLFNAGNSNNNWKNRSDDKGPEPEGVATAVIAGATYAFIGLERIGGVMVYDISDPAAPVFVQYVNSRDLGEQAGGDLGPEGIIYIPAEDSPTDTALVVVANEVSATLSFYHLKGVFTDVPLIVSPTAPMIAFPNPARETVFLEQIDDYQLFDLLGRPLKRVQQQNRIDVSDLPVGMYLLMRKDGASARIAVQR